ncbi:MAG: outer membrane beta-barrel protein [Salibacteraceae bacterium]
MKKHILTVIAIYFAFGSFAQVKEDIRFAPEKGDAGIVFNVAGFISNISVAPTQDPMGNELILGKYYLKDNQAIRLGLGMKSYNNEINSVDSVGSAKQSRDSTYKQFNLYLSPGYEYHFKNFKRLDPYVGVGINLGLIGKTKIQIDESSTDTTGQDKRQTTFNRDGGFMFGVNGVVGFNYYVAPRLSIGLEYNIGYYWQRQGGDYERVTVETPVSGQTISTREIGSDRLVTGGFDHSNNLSINVSYFFGLSKSKGS